MRVPLIRGLSLVFGAGLALGVQAADLTVSAAASLSNALRDIAPLFEAANPGTRVQYNFAASGVLLQQMAKGAPVDVFASADQDTMDQAQARGLVRASQRRDFVSNRLVVIVPANSPRTPASLADLAQPGYARIAIGLPASVPVGRYTKGVLEAAGQWRAIEARMVGATNVRQALLKPSDVYTNTRPAVPMPRRVSALTAPCESGTSRFSPFFVIGRCAMRRRRSMFSHKSPRISPWRIAVSMARQMIEYISWFRCAAAARRMRRSSPQVMRRSRPGCRICSTPRLPMPIRIPPPMRMSTTGRPSRC